MSDKTLPPRIKQCLLITAVVSKWNPENISYSILSLDSPTETFAKDVGKTTIDDYGNIRKTLEVRELSLDLPQWEGLKASDIAVEALENHKEKLRADFTKTMAEVQARINTYLALPNEAEVIDLPSDAELRPAEDLNEDDLPF